MTSEFCLRSRNFVSLQSAAVSRDFSLEQANPAIGSSTSKTEFDVLTQEIMSRRLKPRETCMMFTYIIYLTKLA